MGVELLDDLVAFTTKRIYLVLKHKCYSNCRCCTCPNVGAYGQEIEQVLESVHAYDLKEEKYVTIKKEDMNLGYRQSIFNQGKDAGRYLIISIRIHLSHDRTYSSFSILLYKVM